MEGYSDEESGISDSEIEIYAEKPYVGLQTGTYKVMTIKGTLRCPFCAGKKKQDYALKDLHQHASGSAGPWCPPVLAREGTEFKKRYKFCIVFVSHSQRCLMGRSGMGWAQIKMKRVGPLI